MISHIKIKNIPTRYKANRLKLIPEIYRKGPDDNPILAIALECNANYLVTGDKRDLLSMRRIGLTPIVSAAEFLAILE